MAVVTVVEGDLLHQTDVDALVNAWNRNLVPATRFTIAAVSRAILHAAEPEPYRELHRHALPAAARRRRPPAAPSDHPGRRHQSAPPRHRGRCRRRGPLMPRTSPPSTSWRVSRSPALGAGNGRLPGDLALRTMIDAMTASRTDVAYRVARYRNPSTPPSERLAS